MSAEDHAVHNGPADQAGQVVLREVREADLPILFEQQLDPLATQMADFPSRDEPAFMAHWARILADSSNITRTIVLGGQVAGHLGCWEHEGQREVGYWLGREYWGQGIAGQALALFLRDFPARPLYAYTARHNIASQRVLQKCGFRIYSAGEVASATSGDKADGLTFVLGQD